MNETNDCLYDWVIESFTQPIRSKDHINLWMKQMTVFMIEPLHYSLNPFFQKHLLKWVSHWIINSTDLFKKADSFGNETEKLYIADVLLWI